MKNIIGSPVSGENFVDREREIKRALLLMEDGNSFLLLGIRRTGKSSLLKEIARRMTANDFQTISVNCSTCKTTLQFYQQLYSAMPKGTRERLRKWIADAKSIPTRLLDWLTDFVDKAKVGEVELDFHNNWAVYNSTLEQIVGDFFKKEQRVAIFLDELPFFFQNLGTSAQSIKEIQSALATLRTWRDGGLPMGIAGSLNIHLQLEHLGISRKLLSGLNSLPVEPFLRPVAVDLLTRLAESKKYDWWTSEITDKLLSLLPDFVPYFIQYGFNSVAAAHCDSPDKVETVYHNTIIPGLFKDFLYQFDERLVAFDRDERMIAAGILDSVAQEGKVSLQYLQQDNNFRYDVLMKLLDLEFLTIRGNDEYAFSLNFIQQWWLNKSGN
jgi:hypothetical protein